MRRISSIFLLLVFALIANTGSAQSGRDSLPRRGYFGVSLEKSEAGVRVFAVTPDSTASAAGIMIGDIIKTIDGVDITAPDAVRLESTRVENRSKSGSQEAPSPPR